MITTVRGLKIAYDDTGAGDALVFVHAGIADRRMWRHQLEFFNRPFRTIALDLPGFGESDHERPGSPRAQEIVVGLMDELGIERATLVGDSMGGEVALRVALEQPARVTKLVLVSTRAGVTEPSAQLRALWDAADEAFGRGDIEQAVQIEAAGWIDGRGRVPDDVDPAFRALAVEMIRLTWERAAEVEDQEGPSGEVPEVPEIHVSSRLGELNVPVLLIRGDRDLVEIETSMDVLAAGIAGSRLELIENTAHLPPLERPKEFNARLEEFLGI